MAQTLCYLPGEKISDPALWTTLRTWQKNQNLSADKIRWTPDFLQAEGIDRDELAGALALLRNGQIQKVVYMEPRARAAKDLDWLAFACSCVQLGIAVEDAAGQPLLTAEKATVLQDLFNKASKKPAPPARRSTRV
ncbi:MAG: hypothetical protein M3Q07_03960 [Pseudobdellovibrionaceae bacterium]|nr:hypothetical protein [Pseudobdellovibrionaceae bacterium]